MKQVSQIIGFIFFKRKCVFKFKKEIKGLKLIYIYTDMIL